MLKQRTTVTLDRRLLEKFYKTYPLMKLSSYLNSLMERALADSEEESYRDIKMKNRMAYMFGISLPRVEAILAAYNDRPLQGLAAFASYTKHARLVITTNHTAEFAFIDIYQAQKLAAKENVKLREAKRICTKEITIDTHETKTLKEVCYLLADVQVQAQSLEDAQNLFLKLMEEQEDEKSD